MNLLTQPTQKNIEIAAQKLKQQELVAFPTDTVFGIGGIMQPEIIEKIYQLKKRSRSKPLILLCSNIEQIESIAKEIPPLFYELAKQFFPGPLSIILKKQPHISDTMTAGEPTVGVRIPNHPTALELIKAVGEPIATTSANLSGDSDLFSAEAVQQSVLGKDIGVIFGGHCPLEQASTVISLASAKPVVLREGVLPSRLFL